MTARKDCSDKVVFECRTGRSATTLAAYSTVSNGLCLCETPKPQLGEEHAVYPRWCLSRHHFENCPLAYQWPLISTRSIACFHFPAVREMFRGERIMSVQMCDRRLESREPHRERDDVSTAAGKGAKLDACSASRRRLTTCATAFGLFSAYTRLPTSQDMIVLNKPNHGRDGYENCSTAHCELRLRSHDSIPVIDATNHGSYYRCWSVRD